MPEETSPPVSRCPLLFNGHVWGRTQHSTRALVDLHSVTWEKNAHLGNSGGGKNNEGPPINDVHIEGVGRVGS